MDNGLWCTQRQGLSPQRIGMFAGIVRSRGKIVQVFSKTTEIIVGGVHVKVS